MLLLRLVYLRSFLIIIHGICSSEKKIKNPQKPHTQYKLKSTFPEMSSTTILHIVILVFLFLTLLVNIFLKVKLIFLYQEKRIPLRIDRGASKPIGVTWLEFLIPKWNRLCFLFVMQTLLRLCSRSPRCNLVALVTNQLQGVGAEIKASCRFNEISIQELYTLVLAERMVTGWSFLRRNYHRRNEFGI